MKLSIITINRNNAEGLKRTLDSVKGQTYKGIEHIIVDGASTDDSVQIIESYVRDVSCMMYDVLWISEPDKGIYNAMNKGIEIALGKRGVNALNRSERREDKNKVLPDYIQILNSGDTLAAPDVTERMMAELQRAYSQPLPKRNGVSKGVAILYGNKLKDYGNGRVRRDTCGGEMYTPESFLYFYNGTLNHDCAYIRRDLFEKYGLYNEQMKICSDWEWYVRAIVLGGEKPVYTNVDVTIFDMNGVSESKGKNAELIQKERREYLEKILPASVLRDYDRFAFPMLQYQRLKKYHLWPLVHFIERILFKLNKWRILK